MLSSWSSSWKHFQDNNGSKMINLVRQWKVVEDQERIIAASCGLDIMKTENLPNHKYYSYSFSNEGFATLSKEKSVVFWKLPVPLLGFHLLIQQSGYNQPVKSSFLDEVSTMLSQNELESRTRKQNFSISDPEKNPKTKNWNFLISGQVNEVSFCRVRFHYYTYFQNYATCVVGTWKVFLVFWCRQSNSDDLFFIQKSSKWS